LTVAIELPSLGIFAGGCYGNRRRLASWHCTNSGRQSPVSRWGFPLWNVNVTAVRGILGEGTSLVRVVLGNPDDMSDAPAAASGEQAPEDTADRSVGTLELFFDLVFVYAMSQVTILMLADISWAGFGRGLLALAAVWWARVCYAWLTNAFDYAGPAHRLLIQVQGLGDLAVIGQCVPERSH
jgi:hypothetical protein